MRPSAKRPSDDYLQTLVHRVRRLPDEASAVEFLKRQALATEELDACKKSCKKSAQRKTSKRKRPWYQRVPSELRDGIDLVNGLRAAAVDGPDTRSLQDLDDACTRALADWCFENAAWLTHAKRLRTLPAAPLDKLTGGQALVTGALVALVMRNRYPENYADTADIDLLIGASQMRVCWRKECGQAVTAAGVPCWSCGKRQKLKNVLLVLGITGDLAALLVTLGERPEWRPRIRRCLYMFNKRGKPLRDGCLKLFLDRSSTTAARACRKQHTIKVDKYERLYAGPIVNELFPTNKASSGPPSPWRRHSVAADPAAAGSK